MDFFFLFSVYVVCILPYCVINDHYGFDRSFDALYMCVNAMPNAYKN